MFVSVHFSVGDHPIRLHSIFLRSKVNKRMFPLTHGIDMHENLRFCCQLKWLI